MVFNPAQYQTVADQLSARLQTASLKVAEVRPAAAAGVDHWYVPSHLASAAKSLGDKLAEMAGNLLDKIGELLKCIAAPVMIFLKAQDWQTDVRGGASSVAGNTAAAALKAPLVWKGDAADAYTQAVKDQPTAATQIKNSADTVATALTWCAVSGAAFYAALAAVLYKAIQTLTAAVVLLGSLVFSWAGLVAALGEVAVDAAAVWAAVAALTALLSTQAQQMATIDGVAADNSSFPGGKWPSGTA